MVHGIIPDICIQIDLILIPDRIPLQEPAEARGVDARLVVVHAELGDPGLARILEPADVRALRDAIFVVAADGGDGARSVAHRDDRAALVGVEPAPVALAGAFVPIGSCLPVPS